MTEVSYFGCRLQQRLDNTTTKIFIFTVRVKELKRWVGIRRVQATPQGAQRLLRQSRVSMVRRFLDVVPTNTIPNSVLLAFDPDTAIFTEVECLQSLEIPVDIRNGCDQQLSWGYLTFSFNETGHEEDRPALIVDGQHRINGMAGYENEDLPVVAVGLLDAPRVEQAFQFIVVNEKAVRVPKADAKAILANFAEAEDNLLRDRLIKSGVDYKDESAALKELDDLPNSPFYQMLDWPYNRNGTQIVPITAMEQSIRYLRSIFVALESDQDSTIELLCAIWRAVKSAYPNQWNADGKLLTKVSISALNEYLSQRLKMSWEFDLVDIFDPQMVETYTSSKLIQPLTESFWQANWNVTVQDNSNVRQMIKDDLETMAGNFKAARKWTDDLRLPIIG